MPVLDLLEYKDPEFIAALRHFVALREMPWNILERRTRLSKNTLINLRQNQSIPSSETVRLICEAFGVRRSEFFTTGEKIVDEHRSRKTKELEEKVSQIERLADEDLVAAGIDPEQRRRFVRAAEILLAHLEE